MTGIRICCALGRKIKDEGSCFVKVARRIARFCVTAFKICTAKFKNRVKPYRNINKISIIIDPALYSTNIIIYYIDLHYKVVIVTDAIRPSPLPQSPFLFPSSLPTPFPFPLALPCLHFPLPPLIFNLPHPLPLKTPPTKPILMFYLFTIQHGILLWMATML